MDSLRAVAGDLQDWSRGKYGSIPENIKALKLEVRRMQDEGKGGFELRLVKNNLEVLQQKEDYFGGLDHDLIGLLLEIKTQNISTIIQVKGGAKILLIG